MAHIQDVAAAVIIRDAHVLVTRRAPGQKMAGLWEFPGGKLELGETAQTCVVRELEEELAMTCVAGEVLASNLHRYPGGAINLIAIRVTMTCETWVLNVHDEARWVTAYELRRLDLAPADVPIASAVCDVLAETTAGAQ